MVTKMGAGMAKISSLNKTPSFFDGIKRVERKRLARAVEELTEIAQGIGVVVQSFQQSTKMLRSEHFPSKRKNKSSCSKC